MFPLKSSEFRLDDDQFSKLEGGEGKKNELLNLNLEYVERKKKKNLSGKDFVDASVGFFGKMHFGVLA